MLLDTNYFFATNKRNSYYLLGVLNSRLITFWINSEDTQVGGGGAYRHYKYNLEKLCIPKIKDVSSIEDDVLQILQCLKENKDIAKHEADLNRKVYQLYDLSDNEVAFIESLQSQ